MASSFHDKIYVYRTRVSNNIAYWCTFYNSSGQVATGSVTNEYEPFMSDSLETITKIVYDGMTFLCNCELTRTEKSFYLYLDELEWDDGDHGDVYSGNKRIEAIYLGENCLYEKPQYQKAEYLIIEDIGTYDNLSEETPEYTKQYWWDYAWYVSHTTVNSDETYFNAFAIDAEHLGSKVLQNTNTTITYNGIQYYVWEKIDTDSNSGQNDLYLTQTDDYHELQKFALIEHPNNRLTPIRQVLDEDSNMRYANTYTNSQFCLITAKLS